MTELELKETEKVKRKIPKWFKNGGQINSKILIAFMQLSNKNAKSVSIQDLVNSDTSIDIRKNYQEMKEIYEKNHAKVFDEDSSGMITLWQPVADFICEEYDKWLGGVEPLPTPNTQNMTIPPLNQILYGPPGDGQDL